MLLSLNLIASGPGHTHSTEREVTSRELALRASASKSRAACFPLMVIVPMGG